MTDYDGRPLEVYALYHKEHQSPSLEPISGPMYWNFLEMHFDPRSVDPAFALKLRNLIDAPSAEVRGGGSVETSAADTGRPFRSQLPELTTLSRADVRFTTLAGEPVRGTRSQPDGKIPVRGLADVLPGTDLLMVANNGAEQEVQKITTQALS